MHEQLTNQCLALAIASGVSLVAASAAEAPKPAETAKPVDALSATKPAEAAPPQVSDTEKWIQDVKKPVSWLSWGGDLRLRNEYINNGQSLGSPNGKLFGEQDYFRFRGRIWTVITPLDDLSLNARLATEPRVWMKPASYTPYKTAAGHSGLDMTEGVIDSLNVQWKDPGNLPMKLTIGRQDLMLGEGWLTGDGTPYDGSWTYYLDAARVTYELKDQKTTIDAIGIIQSAKDDAWLPTINNNDRYTSEQDEKGAILNIGNKTLPYANLDGYFIYKNDIPTGSKATPPGDRGDIYTVGGRVSGLVADHWKYYAEGAYQFGEKQDPLIAPASTAYHDLSAFGVNNKLTYLFKDTLNNQVSLSYEYLTGDDPKTGNDEMFDILWGRYPRWSELYNIYSYAPESRVGQTSNLHRFGPGWTISPTKKLDFTANYYALFADQDVPTRASAGNLPLFSQTGSFRGHYLQTVLKYKYNAHLSGHLWAEFVFPGDFYTYHDTMSFLRGEINLTF